jgi:hypothetical protein
MSDEDEICIDSHSESDLFKDTTSPEDNFKQDKNLYMNNIDIFNRISKFNSNEVLKSENNALKILYQIDSSGQIKYGSNSEEQGNPHDSNYYQKQVNYFFTHFLPSPSSSPV